MGWSHLFCTALSPDFSRQDDIRVCADCMLKCGFHKNTLGNCSCTLWGHDEKDIKCSCEKLCSQTWENLAVNIYSVNYSDRLWHKLHLGNWKHPWILKRKYTHTHMHTHTQTYTYTTWCEIFQRMKNLKAIIHLILFVLHCQLKHLLVCNNLFYLTFKNEI